MEEGSMEEGMEGMEEGMGEGMEEGMEKGRKKCTDEAERTIQQDAECVKTVDIGKKQNTY
tara:strand:+ start:485 stop:664 length:180 start_codon:yes stop_codon:yes gene_type:complete